MISYPQLHMIYIYILILLGFYSTPPTSLSRGPSRSSSPVPCNTFDIILDMPNQSNSDRDVGRGSLGTKGSLSSGSDRGNGSKGSSSVSPHR